MHLPRRTRPAAVLAALASLIPSHALSQAPPKPVELSAGHLRLSLAPGAGLTLTVHGVPFLTESSLYIVTPGWTKVYLNQDKLPGMIARAEDVSAEPIGPGVKAAVAEYHTPEASALYRYELHPDDTFRVRVHYRTRDEVGAVAQYHTYLNANVLAGAPFTAETVAGPREGTIPIVPKEGTQDQRKFTPDLKRITFNSRLGDITVEVESNAPETSALTFFEARTETQAWAMKRPILWLGAGVPAKPVAKGGTTITTTYRFGTPKFGGTVPTATGTAKVIPLPAAWRPGAVERPIIPRPKEMRSLDGPVVRQMAGFEIVIPDNPAPEEKVAARELVAEFGTFWGVSAKIYRESASRPIHDIRPLTILLGRGKAFRSGTLKNSPVAVPDRMEGYVLRAAEDLDVFVSGSYATVLVLGRDARGVYNGAQTLKQLIRRDAEGVYVKPVAIRDWPSLSFRGVHWFGGPNSLPFHHRMISRIAAPLKLNAMVYELEYTQWESQKGIWHPERSTPKAQVKRAVEIARGHFLEPIPLIPTLGHMEWLFRNGQNRDLVMDPEKPYAYNPDVPRAYDVILPLFEEAIEMFRPKYFHFGHDEVSMTGRFPVPGYPKTGTQLFIEDTVRLHRWLTDRGLKPMMWGDQMLHESEGITSSWCETPEDAKARREALPKDIIIADWHYRNADPTFPSIGIFQRLGYPVIGTGWAEPDALRNFVRSLVREKSMGYFQSTWAGYAMSEEIVTGPEFPQFVGYLLAAEYAWNGGEPELADLGYSPDQAFLHFWNRAPDAAKDRPGFTVDLCSMSNADLSRWLDWKAARTGVVDPCVFQPSGAMLLSGSLNPDGRWPESARFALRRKADALHFLWGTTNAVPTGTNVANLRVTYDDGAKVEAPIVYGKHVFAFTDARIALEAPVTWRGRTSDGAKASLRRWAWANPHPEKVIRSVEVVSAGTEAAPVLIGLTGVG